MRLFKKMFGAADPLASVRRAAQDERWADVLISGERASREELTPEDRAELDDLLARAGDGLAELNIAEGEACVRSGDTVQARDHFSLAKTHARSARFAQTAVDALKGLDEGADVKAPSSSGRKCATGCIIPGGSSESYEPQDDLDRETRMDLILGSYPHELRKRYLSSSVLFQEAFLLSHEGRENEALELLNRVCREEQTDIFYYERGSVLGRLGRPEEACRDLEKAIELNDENELAMESLAAMEYASGQTEKAERMVRGMLEKGLALPFCHCFLAEFLAERGELDTALEHGRKAIELGGADRNTVLLTIKLLEQSGRNREAKALMKQLTGCGC